MAALLADLRFALRQLLRRPGFTLLAVATLGLGTGASAAMFGIVDRVLLRPLPFPESNRLVALCETNTSLEGFCVASPPNVEDWSRESRSLASVGLGREWPFTMREGGTSEGVSGGLATPGLFSTLGITPLFGRLLTADDLTPSGRHVAVLSAAFWQSRFGSDRGVLGRFLSLDGEAYEIVGVLRPGAEVPHLGRARFWLPLPFDPRDEENRRWRGFATIGRLAEGVSVRDAETELRALQDRLALQHPETNRGWSARAEPLLDSVVGPVRPTLLVFLGAVILLLVVACTNVANLLVARGVAREREFAVRAAVGARPMALFRLLAVESVTLALLGGVAGLFVASWVATALLALMPGGLPRIEHAAGFDARTMGVAVLVTLAVGLLTGLAPALRAARLDLGVAMKAGHQSSGWRRALGLRGALVSAQVSLAVVLAVGAGLLTRGYASLLRWEPGFDRSHLVTFWTYASSGTYRSPASVSALFARLEGEMRTLPGVSSVGMTSNGPLFGGEETGEFLPAGGDSSAAPMAARWYDMSPSYFTTLGLPLRMGRWFTDADGPGAPRVALINEAMARRYFAGRTPLGQVIRQRNDPTPLTIIGVVADIARFVPGQATAPEIYWPQRQSPRWASYFVLRTSGDPASLGRAIAARLAAVDPDLQPGTVRTMDDLVAGELARPRFHMLLIGTFAVLALALTFVGVYGVIAASVVSRTREIGVRIALGATEGRVLGMVLREGLAMAGVGLGVGLATAVLAARFATSLFSGISFADPPTYATTALLIAGAAVLACLVPARRAARVEPTEALRAD